jgi:hypothetical protein
MKIMYRLRFIPLMISIAFLLFSILLAVGFFAGMGAIALPYQDPTPEMIERQMEAIRFMESQVPRVISIVVTGLCTTVLYTMFLLYLRYKRKRAE